MNEARAKVYESVVSNLEFYIREHYPEIDGGFDYGPLSDLITTSVAAEILSIMIKEDRDIVKAINRDIEATEKDYNHDDISMRFAAQSGAFKEKFRWAEQQRKNILKICER